MIKPIDFNESIPYVLKDDRGSKKKTVWKFRPLELQEEVHLKRVAIEATNSDDRMKMFEVLPAFLHVALESADNWAGEFKRDETAVAVFGDIKPWSDKTLKQIRQEHREELAAFVMRGYSDISDDELKN